MRALRILQTNGNPSVLYDEDRSIGASKCPLHIGVPVRVATTCFRIGGPKYPGRTGVVVARNDYGRDDHGGLWYVRLTATRRANDCKAPVM